MNLLELAVFEDKLLREELLDLCPSAEPELDDAP